MKKYSWFKLTAPQKQALSEQKAIFVAGARDLSPERIAQLTQSLIKRGPVVWGCLENPYIEGLTGCPQFQSLKQQKLTDTLKNLALTEQNLPEQNLPAQNSISILNYHQKDFKYLLNELDFKALILINGSWQYAFHLRPEFFTVLKKHLTYKLVSPFSSEPEAKAYAEKLVPQVAAKFQPNFQLSYSPDQLMALCQPVAKQSFDHTFQTGAVLARGQQILLASYNRVVPYATYAWHHGASKEKHSAPPQDLNYYDTNHAEVEILIQATQQHLDLAGTTLYINLLPCPTCARMLASTPIKEIIYQHDHSDGYAFKLLTEAGKLVKRLPNVG